MKALMLLQEEQEDYIQTTRREKQELRQEMENKSRSLDEAQKQLEEVRANRHRVDQDVMVRALSTLQCFSRDSLSLSLFIYVYISKLCSVQMNCVQMSS